MRLLDELRSVARLGAPIATIRLASFIPKAIMLAAVGSLTDGAPLLAAAGTASMWCNVTGVSIIVGTGFGGSTLLSQAYGARNYKRVGILLQRQLLIHALVILFFSLPTSLASEYLLRDVLGQPPATSALASSFIKWRAIALPLFALNIDLTNYLVAQRVAKMPAAVNVGCSLLLVPLLAALTRDDSLGFAGAPISLTIMEILQGLLMIALTPWALRRADRESRTSCHLATLPRIGRRRDWGLAMRQWGELLKLGAPSAVMTMAEWLGWETSLFAAGRLCDGEACPQLEAYPIVSQTMVLSFMVHYGFACAASTRLGNFLGAGDAVAARVSAQAAFAAVLPLVTLVCLPILAFRHQWAELFVAEPSPELKATVAAVLPFVVAYIFMDAIGPAASHQVLYGLGHIRFGAVFNVFAFWVVAIPLGTALAPALGIEGLWIGLDTGMALLVLALVTYICRVDWVKAAESARRRALAHSSDGGGAVGSKGGGDEADGLPPAWDDVEQTPEQSKTMGLESVALSEVIDEAPMLLSSSRS